MSTIQKKIKEGDIEWFHENINIFIRNPEENIKRMLNNDFPKLFIRVIEYADKNNDIYTLIRLNEFFTILNTTWDFTFNIKDSIVWYFSVKNVQYNNIFDIFKDSSSHIGLRIISGILSNDKVVDIDKIDFIIYDFIQSDIVYCFLECLSHHSIYGEYIYNKIESDQSIKDFLSRDDISLLYNEIKIEKTNNLLSEFLEKNGHILK